MSTLETVEIKAFVPAKQFAVSQQFYCDLGFTKASLHADVAYFHHGDTAFLLQDFYAEELALNLQMHLLVKDAAAWWTHVDSLDLPARYGVRAATPLAAQPWGMLDFTVTDPCGVCWRIAQNLPGFSPVGKTGAA